MLPIYLGLSNYSYAVMSEHISELLTENGKQRQWYNPSGVRDGCTQV